MSHRLIFGHAFFIGSLAVGLGLLAVRADEPASDKKDEAPVESPAGGGSDVSPTERLRFEQDKAQAHMRELEDRMYRLAELIRETQPDDAARLRMGVEKSREELIVEQMDAVSRLLDGLDLEKATGEQKQIIVKLEELKKLLLTSDLGMELKLEQLRKVREARQRLGRLMGKESRQHKQTQGMAGNPKGSDEEQKRQLERLQREEERNEQSGRELQRLVKTIGSSASKAAGSMGGACKSMGGACGKLGQGKPGEASKDQQNALAEMKRADEALAELEQKLQQELEASVRQRVMDNLQEMLAQQEAVREATERLAPRAAEGYRQAVLAVRRLAGAEDRIIALCDESIEMIELVKFSLVLPAALGTIQAKMTDVSDALTEGRADSDVLAREREIVADLEALLDAMKAAAGSGGKGKPGGKCQGCGRDRNKLLAEVKILRWMQTAVNQESQRVLQLKEEGETSKVELRARMDDVMQRQETVRAITQKLHESTCPKCTQGEEF